MTAIYDQIPNHDNGEEKVSQIERMRATVDSIKSLAGVPLEQPSPRREDTPIPEGYVNSPEKEAEIRSLAESLGIGTLQDITPDMVGAPTTCTSIVEAGLVWKMQAELEVALGSGKGAVVMGASRFEKPNDIELGKLSELTGKPIDDLRGISQYEAAYTILTHQNGFEPAADTVELNAELAPLNGDLPKDFDNQGDILFTGKINGRDIYLYDVPRRQDPERPGKFQAFRVSDIVEHISANDFGGNGICLVTSTSYLPTRAIECDKATERGVAEIYVAGYGQIALARYKSGGEVKPVALNQILAEVASTDKKLG